jgi:hypothetical protein
MVSVRGLYCMFIKITSAPAFCSVSTPASSAALKPSTSTRRMASLVPVCHITKSGFSSISNLAMPLAMSSAVWRLRTRVTTLLSMAGMRFLSAASSRAG